MDQHWLEYCLVTCSVTSHYLNQWMLFVNKIIGTNFIEIWMKIWQFSYKKGKERILKISRPFCLDVLSQMLMRWKRTPDISLNIYLDIFPCFLMISVVCHPTHSEINQVTWWRHQMAAFSALLALCAGNSPVTGQFPAQRPVTRGFDVFFDLHLNKQLRKTIVGLVIWDAIAPIITSL